VNATLYKVLGARRADRMASVSSRTSRSQGSSSSQTVPSFAGDFPGAGALWSLTPAPRQAQDDSDPRVIATFAAEGVFSSLLSDARRGEVNDELRVEDEPRSEDVTTLNERLYQYNVAVTGCDDGRWLAIFVRDATGEMVAGLHGWTWGQTGFVQSLWVREDLRGQGLGRRLLGAAEAEAARRACREMQLDTHSYQAPGFYRHLGYAPIGELPGWPRDTSRIFFRKALPPPDQGSISERA
jgi:GNAT superfamily N-acetyltransferase